MENPLVNSKYLLQKFPGKGGWTYAVIPEILQNKNNPFGWVKVKGSIDGYELNPNLSFWRLLEPRSKTKDLITNKLTLKTFHFD